MEEPKVSIKAAFEWISNPALKSCELGTAHQHSATVWLLESLQHTQNSKSAPGALVFHWGYVY